MPTLIHRRVAEARGGANPKMICRTRAGWAVMGDMQFLPGYCLLLPDPVVPSLNDLAPERRGLFLEEMAVLGDALLMVTNATRVNYEILGNLEPALHVHVFPRFAHESDDVRHRPVWFYSEPRVPEFDLDRDRPLMRKIASYLEERGVAAE